MSQIQKYMPQLQQRTKYKKQCLKAKNILFQNQQIQLGCKIVPLYDFYSSTHYLQLNFFIGNKTDRPLSSFSLDFRASSNLQIFIEQKQRVVRQRTQYKERVVLGCNQYQQQILLLLDFQSPLITLKATPVPVTLYNFCIFSRGESIPAVGNENDLNQLLEHKYEYVQEKELPVNSPIFKKGLNHEIQKYFMQMTRICQGVFIGTFSIHSLANEFSLVFKVIAQKRVAICLASNEYGMFEQLFGNFKMILQ